MGAQRINQVFLDLQKALKVEDYAVDLDKVDLDDFQNLGTEISPVSSASEDDQALLEEVVDSYLKPIANDPSFHRSEDAKKALPIAAVLSDEHLGNLIDFKSDTEVTGLIPDYFVPVEFTAEIMRIPLNQLVKLPDETSVDNVGKYLDSVSIEASFDENGKMILDSIIPSIKSDDGEIYGLDEYGIKIDIEKIKKNLSATPYLKANADGTYDYSANSDDGTQAVDTYRKQREAEIAAYEASYYDNSELLKLCLYSGAGLAVGAIAGLALAAATATTWPLACVALVGGVGCAFGDVSFQVVDQGINLSNIDKGEVLSAALTGGFILFSVGSLIEIGTQVSAQYAAAQGLGQTSRVLASGLGRMLGNVLSPKITTSSTGWARTASWVGRKFMGMP